LIFRQLGHLFKTSTAFCPFLGEGLALSRIRFFTLSFYLFGGPLKHLSQKEDLKMLMDLTFRRKILNYIVGFLKVLLYPSPPLEGESFVKIV